MALCMLLLLLCVAALSFCSGKVPKPKEGHDQFLSPYNQNLPNCKQGFTKIRKKTKEKAILCPMFKDEMGFLNEWIAYYKLQGFDHIMMFDDDSSDDYASEIAPWVKSGFVSVKANWTTESLNMHPNFARNEFKRAMTSKQLLERSCKLKAIEWGYKYFVSLDIDEYLIPSPGRPEDETLVDELDSWFSLSKGHHMICIQKLNFQSTWVGGCTHQMEARCHTSSIDDIYKLSERSICMCVPRVAFSLCHHTNPVHRTQTQYIQYIQYTQHTTQL